MNVRHHTIPVALAALLAVSGCALEVQNTQPARDYAQETRPPGSVYMGWRVFQDRCASCHGSAATGSPRAPDLLPRMRGMGAHRFVNVVLNRYDWHLPAEQVQRGGAQREALVEQIVQRREAALGMPAWQGEPRVNAHIVDLYAYLSARAEGRQGPDRPAP